MKRRDQRIAGTGTVEFDYEEKLRWFGHGACRNDDDSFILCMTMEVNGTEGVQERRDGIVLAPCGLRGCKN